jgi:hypothetical protein
MSAGTCPKSMSMLVLHYGYCNGNGFYTSLNEECWIRHSLLEGKRCVLRHIKEGGRIECTISCGEY